MSQNRYDPLHQVAVDDAADANDHEMRAEGGERIAKRLARAGICSRRDAEKLIADGRVSVNGRLLDSAAFLVRDGDMIKVDGKPVAAPEPTRLWRYHKPDGLVTTARDEQGRATVFDHLPRDLPRVISVGRLDLSSEGLLLLTNDGGLARFLELPSTGWLRRYRIRVHGVPTPETMKRLADGVVVDGIAYGPIETVIDRTVGYNSWLTVGLREGKNREVRRVFDYLGLPVSRLIRTAYGPFQLGKLERGAVEEVPRRVLRDQIPSFFPEEETEETVVAARRPTTPRMRYDQLPKAAAATAAPSATKGAKPAAKAGPRPSAAKARDQVERLVGGGPRKAVTAPLKPAATKNAAATPGPSKTGKRGAALTDAQRKAVAAMDRALSKGDVPPAETGARPGRKAVPRDQGAVSERKPNGGKGADRRR